MKKHSLALGALGLSLALSACSTTVAPPRSAAPSSSGSPAAEVSLEDAASEYAELRDGQEIQRILAQGMVNDGYAEEDVEVAQEGVEAVIAEIEDFASGLAEIEFPAEVQEEADAVAELSAQEVAVLEEALEARTFEEFDEAYQEYISLPISAYEDLRNVLSVADSGIPVPEGSEVYEDDFSDDHNSWEIFEDEFAASRYVDDEFELSSVVGSFASSAPLDVHGFDRDRTLISVDAEVVSGPEDETFSYGVTCPSESALDDGLHAELLGSGGYTFYRTLSTDPDGLQYYLFSPDPLEQVDLGRENHLDVLCSQHEDRTIVQLWVNGVYVDGTSFPFELPSRSAANGDGALTMTVDPGTESGAVVRFDDWSVSVADPVE